jgi:D-serine deaminase-like pyridoxal phosphate-dependent protein
VTLRAHLPAEVGMHLQEVDTPALLVDLEAFTRNLKDALKARGIKLRE